MMLMYSDGFIEQNVIVWERHVCKPGSPILTRMSLRMAYLDAFGDVFLDMFGTGVGDPDETFVLLRSFHLPGPTYVAWKVPMHRM